MTQRRESQMDDKPTPPPLPIPAPPASRGRGPKPPDDVPWTHQPGCTNPVSDDWSCACGPEVIKA